MRYRDAPQAYKKQAPQTEYKTLAFKAEDYDEESGIFSGYAAVFGNIDAGGDIVEVGAFSKALEAGIERVKILSGHNDYQLPIGKPLELREDETGLYIKARISDTALGRDIKTLLRDGVLNELSIGYDPIIFDYDEDGIRHLRELRLWEVSVVTWAMNPEATITGYKAADAVAAQTEQMIAEAVDIKEGRKISTARIKTLREACEGMKSAVKILEALIRDAEGEKAEEQPRRRRLKMVAKEPMIQITY